MTDGSVSAPSSIVMARGRIEALEPAASLSGALDANGMFLCPGLIDGHVHFFFDCGASPRASFTASDDRARLELARRNARVALESGITTMRDCGAPAPLVFELQREIDAGSTPGPHILACGTPIMRVAGHCHFLGGEVGSVRDVRRHVERQLAQGASFVKLIASGGGLTPGTDPAAADLPAEFIGAAVEAAHAHGVQVTAHCHATESITRAVDQRIDMIEHASFVEASGTYRYDDGVAQRIRDAGIAVSPTVIAALRTARRFRASGARHNPLDVSAIERLEGRLTNVGHFRRLGVRILAGTDCGCTDTPFSSLVDELLAYAAAGMSNLAALQSATAAAAGILGLKGVGEVRVGARADLILLDGNPLEDLTALRAPRMVWKSGQVVHERKSPAPPPP